MPRTKLILISIAILSIFITLPAIACHREISHGQDTNCDVPADDSIMIIDSDDPPNQVGIVSPISPLPVFSHNGQLFGLPIGPRGYIRSQLTFESINCDFFSGDGPLAEIGEANPFFSPEVRINNPGNTVYLERPSSFAVRNIFSFLDDDGTCVLNSPAGVALNTVIMDPIIDLDAVFVPPFKKVGSAPSLLP